MDYLPELLHDTPSATCGMVGCEQAATHHIIWTASLDNGTACDEHLADARRRFVFYAVHPYDDGFCGHPHAVYHLDLNACLIPPEDVDWDAIAAHELPVLAGSV